MRFPFITRRREARERAEFLARQQRILNPALYARVIVATGHALAVDKAGNLEVDVDDTGTHQSVFWPWKPGFDVSAQRMICGTDHAEEIFIEGSDPDDGPWLGTLSDSPWVIFYPGFGFDTAEQFLAWFEAEVGMGVAS